MGAKIIGVQCDEISCNSIMIEKDGMKIELFPDKDAGINAVVHPR